MTGRVDPSSTLLARGLWVAGGVVALLAALLLLVAVEGRSWRLLPRGTAPILFRWHDGVLVLQSVLMIPGAIALSRSSAASRTIAVVLAGGSLLAMAILESLRLINVGPDSMYMLAQGVLGVWVIMISRGGRNTITSAAARVGMITGIGLLMIAASLLATILYFGIGALSGPIRDPSAVGQAVNRYAHYLLRVGSYAGRLGLPIWIFLTAKRDAWR